MKTKLSLIAVAMLVGGWMAVGDSPRVRSMEQRVADLEQLVAEQSFQIAEQQRQLERVMPIVNEMELVTWNDGAKTIRMETCSLWVDDNIQCESLSVVGNIYMFGEIYQY